MIHNYSSHEAIESGECSRADCPEVLVLSDPAASSQIAVPSYVTIRLFTEHPDAIIRYTTDGTEPDRFSTQYTAPILVISVGLGIRARAFLPGCTPGPILNVAFSNPQFPFVFSYACDTPDKGGKWDVWAPSGRNDHHWVLQFTLTGATTIKRLELYQLDSAGKWTTGQVWSTDSPINPWPDQPSDTFACFPLLLFIAAVQQHVAYQSSLGSFGAGTHTWDLYGDIEVALGTGHLFRLDIILADNTELSHIIGNTCAGAPPPICPPPATPTLVGKCGGKIDVTLTGTVGRPYRIFIAAFTDEGEGLSWQQAASGTLDVSPKTVEISGLLLLGLYSVYVSIDEAGCGYKDSAIATTLTPIGPYLAIFTDKTEVDPNESFTIAWETTHIGGAVCGGCLDGQVSINQGLGCKAGNTSGSQATSQAVCGTYVYQITGCNACGTAIASVSVEVRCPANCGASPPASLVVMDNNNYFGSECSFLSGCVDFACEVCQGPTQPTPWNGKVYKIADSPPDLLCRYEASYDCGLFMFGCLYAANCGPNICMYPFLKATIELVVASARWELKLYSCLELIWSGIKTTGNNGVGTYTRTGGCASGPATLFVLEFYF